MMNGRQRLGQTGTYTYVGTIEAYNVGTIEACDDEKRKTIHGKAAQCGIETTI